MTSSEAVLRETGGYAYERVRLIISRWEKQPNTSADNADGKWHILYEISEGGADVDFPDDTEASIVYCQPLPFAKLEYRKRAIPKLIDLLRLYFERATWQFERLREVDTELRRLEAKL